MKVLQLNVTANWGSTGKIAEGIGQAAMNRGWESAIAYGRMMNPSQSQLIKVGNKVDVYMHFAKHQLLDAEGLGSKRPTRQLIKHIEEYQPDIIHLHNIHDHWLNYPLFFEYLNTIETPIVWTFHDCWAFTGGCAYFENPFCDKWKVKCCDCRARHPRLDRTATHFQLKKKLLKSLCNRLTLVPVSAWLENYVKDSFLSAADIQLIHNGIDTTQFNISSHKSQKPLILGVALIWNSRKGLYDFFKLREIIPQEEADITLVGLSQKQIDQLPAGIKGIARTQSLKELCDLYSKSHVLINPTYADNFPTVNLEAMACGTPVVTYRTGGSPEAVDAQTGIVVEKGDVKGLANEVRRIIDNPDLFSAETCRGRVVKYFNKDLQFRKYVDLYESLIQK